jgi:membrane-associated phospholipid phosphatase
MEVNKLVWVVLSGFTLFTIIFVEQGFHESYFEDSLEFIPKLQEGASEFKQKTWDAYSNLGLTLVNAVPMLVPYYWIEQRPRCFYYVVVILAIDAIMAVSKLNDHQARPIWVSEAVKAYGCSNQYGNPSGHCLSTMGITLTCWLDYNTCAMRDPEGVKMSSWVYRLLWFIFVLGFTGSIAYSRMFLGVHALN